MPHAGEYIYKIYVQTSIIAQHTKNSYWGFLLKMGKSLWEGNLQKR